MSTRSSVGTLVLAFAFSWFASGLRVTASTEEGARETSSPQTSAVVAETGPGSVDRAPRDWVRRLGHEDFRTREAAFARLRALGEASREALEEGKTDGDPEIRWRCKRLLKELDRSARDGRSASDTRAEREDVRGGVPRSAPRADASADPRSAGDPGRFDPLGLLDEALADPFGGDEDGETMARALERFLEERRSFGAGDSPFGKELPGGGIGHDLFRIFDSTADPFARHRELLERLEAMHSRGAHGSSIGELGGTSVISIRKQVGGRSLEFRADAEGARATVRHTDAEDVETTETFEAEDLESFRSMYPDVAAELGLDGAAPGSRGKSGRGGGFGLSAPPPGSPTPRTPAPVPPAPNPPKRLGILCGEVAPILRHHLELRPDEGILVEEVEPGSTAYSLGLRAYDILVRIDGVPVSTPAEVRQHMQEIDSGDSLNVEIIRSGKKRSLKGTVRD